MTSSETAFNDEELSISDATLIARLRSVHTSADDEAAADRIEQLKHRLFQCATDLQIYMDAYAVSEIKLKTAEEIGRAFEEDAGQQRARAEQLVATNEALVEAASLLCASACSEDFTTYYDALQATDAALAALKPDAKGGA